MRFRLSTAMLVIALVCLVCGLVENVARHWIFLGEMTSNYTRVETHAYWIGFQGAIAGSILCAIIGLVLQMIQSRVLACSTIPPRGIAIRTRYSQKFAQRLPAKRLVKFE